MNTPISRVQFDWEARHARLAAFQDFHKGSKTFTLTSKGGSPIDMRHYVRAYATASGVFGSTPSPSEIRWLASVYPLHDGADDSFDVWVPFEMTSPFPAASWARGLVAMMCRRMGIEADPDEMLWGSVGIWYSHIVEKMASFGAPEPLLDMAYIAAYRCDPDYKYDAKRHARVFGDLDPDANRVPLLQFYDEVKANANR